MLPWQTLGVGSTDAWGRLLYYRVTAEFTRTVSTGASCAANQLDLCDAGDMTVFTRGDDPSTGAVTEAKFQIGYVSDAPAVIASMGGNGYGGRQADNPTVLITYPAEYPVVGLADDERDNSSVAANANFVARIHSLSGTAACDDTPTEGVAFCEFDDIVTWLSTSVLLNRLVTSGQLP